VYSPVYPALAESGEDEMALRYLTVNYRLAAPELEETLETLLRQCIDAEHTPGVRFSAAPAERIMVQERGGRELLLNEFADVIDGVAGIVCEVVPGLLQPVLKRQAEEKQLTVNTVSTVFGWLMLPLAMRVTSSKAFVIFMLEITMSYLSR
jgi:hypothetical protein